MPSKETMDITNWIITIFALVVACAALVIAIFELRQSKISNILEMEPHIDIVGVNKKTTKEFYFTISNLGKVDINEIYYEYVVLSRDKDSKYIEHQHVSDDLDGVLKAGKEMPFKIILNKSILPEGPRVISPILDPIIKTIVFIGLKIKYRREVDSKPFEEKFYYYVLPDTSKSYFRSGPIKLENMTARMWMSDIMRIDEALQF